MSTGTGTGTPAAGASSLTLNAIRDRVRTQLEHAHGAPDPVPILSSTETLATLRDRVELHLQDSGNTKWAADDVDEAIAKALEEYNRHSPRLAVTTLTLTADGREVVSPACRTSSVSTKFGGPTTAPPRRRGFTRPPGPSSISGPCRG